MLLPKENPIRDRDYLTFLRTQPCILTGWNGTEHDPVEAAHIGTLGKGIKSSDDRCLPMRHSYHARGHQEGEVSMLRKQAPDWLMRAAFQAYAEKMYEQYCKDRDTGNL